MSIEVHLADAESTFMAVNVTPDFCLVDGQVVPFDIVALLPPEKAQYAETVFSRSKKALMVDSLVAGVIGNTGEGVLSAVSLKRGHVKIISGSSTVLIEGRQAARHRDTCQMNGAV